jgi:hypothetical protein
MVPHRGLLEGTRGRPEVDQRRILDVLAAEQEHRHRRALHPGVTARVAARVLAGSLDAALIDGADPLSSRRLAARAALLTSRASRSALADGLDQLVAGATHPAGRARLHAPHAPVQANAALLRELAGALRGPAPLYAAGIARLRRLLTDGTGPMYASRDAITLELELLEARAAAAR